MDIDSDGIVSYLMEIGLDEETAGDVRDALAYIGDGRIELARDTLSQHVNEKVIDIIIELVLLDQNKLRRH